MPSKSNSAMTFEEETLAVLRVEASDGATLSSIAEFLGAIDKIHRRFQALDTVFIIVKQSLPLPPSAFHGENLDTLVEKAEVGLTLPKLHAAEFHSPGFWEILGSLSPLKFISDCLAQWREHQKDEQYRDAAEAARLLLENQLRTNEVLKQRIELLRSIGVAEADLQRVFFKPLAAQTATLLASSQSSTVASNSIVNYANTEKNDRLG